MWIQRNRDGSTVYINPAFSTSHNRCPICGQYFQKGEKVVIVIPPNDWSLKLSDKVRKMIRTSYHEDCWIGFVGDITDENELLAKMAKHRVPRKKPFTEDETTRIKAFEDTCRQIGFYPLESQPAYGMKCKKSCHSETLTYNVYLDIIDFDKRGQRELFDGFYEREIIARVRNKMNEILGVDKRDNFSAEKAIGGVMNKAQEMIKDIF